MIKGTAYVLKRNLFPSSTEKTDAGNELQRFREAFASVREDVAGAAESVEIFSAHLAMLDDPLLCENIESAISEGMTAVSAVRIGCERICSMFGDIDDEYLRARTDDVKDLCGRLERKLSGSSSNPFAGLSEGTVIVADELFPSDTALMDFSKISGLVLSKGSATSHVCIIARSKGIPFLVGYDISGIKDGDVLSLEESGSKPVSMPSGVKIYRNAASTEEVAAAISAGADGIGLLRTEFLFMKAKSLPTEDEQYDSYRAALLACEGKPLTIRTLDIGGDKALPYLAMEKEDNPFLGLRGIRFCLAHPEILHTQFKAMVRAANDVPGSRLRIMIPMVDTPEEVHQAKSVLEAAKKELGMEKVPVSFGIMVETPSAVFNAASLASCCDFFSLGTNDLTQYVMAADRGNSTVSYLYDSICPAMREAVRITVEAAHAAGIEVGVCGEAASDPKSAQVLADLGVDSLSLSGI